MHSPGAYRFSKRTYVLILILLLQVVVFSRLAAAGEPNEIPPLVDFHTWPIPARYFGITISDIRNYPEGSLGSLGKASAVFWPYIEPTKGSFDWSRLDAWVQAEQSHGAGGFFYSNDFVPPWAAADPSTCHVRAMGLTACTSTVANIQDWDDFVTALVSRYKGKIQMYELWNEPDQPYAFTGTVAEMVTLTTHMYNTVRSIDPKAAIASPSAGTTWLGEYWAAGGVKTVDVVSLHSYPDPKNPVAESICAVRTLDLKSLMVQYDIKKPIWDTEGSWGGSNTLSDPSLQAAFVARHYILHWACGVSRYYWYLWDSAGFWPYWGDLWSSSTGLNKAGIAFRNVQQWLTGAVMPNSCLMNGAPIPPPKALYYGIYTCELTRPNYQALAVWNTQGPSTFVAPSQFTQYRDLWGGTHTLDANHLVNIGYEPILLEH